MAASPDAFSEVNSPVFLWMRELRNTLPINSSAYNHGNQFPSLATKSPDGAGGYYNNQGTNAEGR